MAFDFDQARSASHVHMLEHLTAPFAGGAVDTELALDLSGGQVVSFAAREPLLLLAPRRPLEALGWRVTVVVTPANSPPVQRELVFAPYTEARAFLPAYRPEVQAETRLALPFSVSVALFEGESAVPVPADTLGEALELRLVQGVFGRLAYALGAEKQRIRRAAREILAMRRLETARGDALDRIGAELGVGRFADELSFEPTPANPSGEIIVKARREPDDELRRRLGLYRPFHRPTRGCAERVLNGPGSAADANAGPLGELGFDARVSIVEEDNPFAVAIMVVSRASSLGVASLRLARFHAHLRAARLIEPVNDVPAHRFLPAAVRTREQALRERLRARFAFAAGQHVAPAVAWALDRVGRCRQALGANAPWQISRAHLPSGGSRYQLGLGVDVPVPAPAELDALASAVASAAWDPAADAETIGLLRTMKPRSAADDPDGAWFLSKCGLRTAHRLSGQRLYLSPIPTLGLVMNVAPGPAFAVETTELEARYHAEGDPGAHALLVDGLAVASAAWLDSGGEPWSVVPEAGMPAALAQLVPPSAPAKSVLMAAGLGVPNDTASLVSALASVSPELYRVIELGPALSAQALAGNTASISAFEALLGAFAGAGIASLLAAHSASRVVLVVSVLGLPQVGANLTGHRTAGFRWYVSPIGETEWEIKHSGSRSRLASQGPGLAAVVVVGYARVGGTDPYQYRVDLPADEVLTLKQYEFLMNALEHLCPLGVGVHTFDIRNAHVDLDGDGAAVPLPPKLARTFRAFRTRRQRGETIDDEPT